MKDKAFIFYGSPCTICLSDPEIQNFQDARRRGWAFCPFYPDRRECSPPACGCIAVSGTRMARYVLQFYSEATEETLAMEREHFRWRAPLPPEDVEAYIDISEHDHRRITDPHQVVQRVWEYARAVLDLKPGERIFRSPEESWEPPLRADLEMAGAEPAKPAVSKAETAGDEPAKPAVSKVRVSKARK